MNTPQPIALLGIPVSKSNLEQTVAHIVEMVGAYRKDLRPRYVGTLHLEDVLTHSPELQQVLRSASLLTLDSSSLRGLSYLLGSPIQDQITSVDLLSPLADALQANNLSLFLLGGKEKTLKLTMLYIQALYPDLKIVGAIHPWIDIEGPAVENADEKDDLILEQINRATPDILLLNLGHSKQEVWFERVRNQLHVPVTIGVGNAFEVLTGTESQASRWLQRSGLEWLYNFFRDPFLQLRNFFIRIFKFPWMVVPLFLFHQMNLGVYHLSNLFKGSVLILRNPLLFISAHQTLAVHPLPKRLNAQVCQEMLDQSDDLFSQDLLVLDFQQVRHIDLEGMALLLQFWNRASRDKKPLYALGISADIRLLLSLHRVWDCIAPYHCSTMEEVVSRLVPDGASAGIYDSIQQMRHQVIISFLGRLDHHLNYSKYLQKIEPILYQKECILDLTYCCYIDNTGIAFLLKLRKIQPHHFISLTLTGLTKEVQQQLRRAGVLSLFKQVSKDNVYIQ